MPEYIKSELQKELDGRTKSVLEINLQKNEIQTAEYLDDVSKRYKQKFKESNLEIVGNEYNFGDGTIDDEWFERVGMLRYANSTYLTYYLERVSSKLDKDNDHLFVRIVSLDGPEKDKAKELFRKAFS